MNNLPENLLKLKKDIEEKQLENAKDEGQLAMLIDELKKLGHDSIEKAEEYLAKLDNTFVKMQNDYEQKLKEIENKYGSTSQGI